MTPSKTIDLTGLGDKPIALFGYGTSGAASAAALSRSGCSVQVWDDSRSQRDAALAAGFPVTDFATSDFSGFGMLLLSPGIPARGPNTHPIVRRARTAGLEIVCDIELLFRACPRATYVGITGTNGKSTTTALLGHILRDAGRPYAVGGNIGTPALDLPALGADGIYVLEISSYQLELLPTAAFNISVLLNISPDHLDHHDGMAGYIEAKRRIFSHHDADATAIVGIDSDPSLAIYDDLTRDGQGRVLPISGSGSARAEGGIYVEDGWLTDARTGTKKPVINLGGITALPGSHNWENAAAAYGAAAALNLAPANIVAGITSFPGLAHRQEHIATIDDVQFVNDSKATNIDAAARALACYDNIYWIAGGRAKEQHGNMELISAYSNRVRHAYLIGEASGEFAQSLQGKIETSLCDDLDHAVAEAAIAAKKDKSGHAVVLLSPAAASFDQFKNFEDRGNAFRAAVTALAGDRLGRSAARAYA